MQTMIIAHSNYNLAPGNRRVVLRSQLTRRRHSLAPETLTVAAATAAAAVMSPPPAITLNGNRVSAGANRAFLPLAQQQQLLTRPYFSHNQRWFSSSASLAAAASLAANANDNGVGVLSAVPISQVAIDSKIEQAMDLVKTHLMFAVREEVESLRSKIVELESTVIHLEAENSILREHVPQTVLQGLQPINDGLNGLSVGGGGAKSGQGHGGADAALLGSAMASLGQPNMAHPQIA